MFNLPHIVFTGLFLCAFLLVGIGLFQTNLAPLASQIQGTWASESGYPLMYITGYRADPPIFYVDYNIRTRVRVHIEASYWDVEVDTKRVEASWPDPESNIETEGKCLARFELDKDLLVVQCAPLNQSYNWKSTEDSPVIVFYRIQ